MSIVVLILILQVAFAEFNFTKCPNPLEIQSDQVKKYFNISKFVGQYYELALHDYTQYPICIFGPRCVTSHKVYDDKLKQVNDTFNLQCFGHVYPNHFVFKLTDIPGHFNGTAGLIPGVLFPDTVVDVYENPPGVYEWVIEFQCVEKFDHVWFIGINWYSRRNDTSLKYVDVMLQAARSQGLDVYMNYGEKVYYVNQTDCELNHM